MEKITKITTTETVEEFPLNDKQIRQALAEYVQKKQKIGGVVEVSIWPDSSYLEEHEENDMFKALVEIKKVTKIAEDVEIP